MSTDRATASTRECPRCGREPAFRVPLPLDDAMNLSRHYRCGTDGQYVYVHAIDYTPSRRSLEDP